MAKRGLCEQVLVMNSVPLSFLDKAHVAPSQFKYMREFGGRVGVYGSEGGGIPSGYGRQKRGRLTYGGVKERDKVR